MSQINAPIFLVGCDRSGTTLLRLMLIQSRTLHITEESNFASLRENGRSYGDCTRPQERQQLIADLQRSRANSSSFIFPVFGLSVVEAEGALAAAAPAPFAQALSALFHASAAKRGKTRWGDKTPRHVLEIPWLAKEYPQALFIHILRDGRDVALSMRKARWVRSNTEAGKFWKERVAAGKRAGASLGLSRYYEVRYESLILQPEGELKKLCTWARLPYEEKMLHYYRSSEAEDTASRNKLHPLLKEPPLSGRVGAWKRDAPRYEVIEFENTAGQLLEELDYRLSGYKIPWLLYWGQVLFSRLKSKASTFLILLTGKGRS